MTNESLRCRDPQDGAVVPDASNHDSGCRAASLPGSDGPRHATNLGNQRFFRQWHDATNIADRDSPVFPPVAESASESLHAGLIQFPK